MKYQLTNLIDCLSKEKISSFKIYSTRYRYKGEEKKLVQLFDLIKNKEYDEYDMKLPKIFFPNGSKNAYYQLKNRLIKEVEDSLLLVHKPKEDEYYALRLLQLASIFYDKGEYSKALYYLHKTEKVAEKLDLGFILNIVYDKWLNLWTHVSQEGLDRVADRGMANLERANFEFRGKVLVSSVKEKLYRSNYSYKSPQTITTHLEDVITALQMADDYSISYKLRLEINQCVRNVMIVRREYRELSKYLMQEYDTLKEEGIFKKSGKEEEIKLLTWIINILLRIKEIEAMNHYISLLENTIDSHHSHVFRQKYKWLLYQCKVISYAYSAKGRQAIDLLLSLEVEREKVPHYPIFVNLNLALLYYYSGEFEQSFDFLAKIILDDSFRSLSPPLQITVLLVELVLRVENGDYTYAQNKYANLRRKYRNYLSRDNYKRDKAFLNLLREIIKEASKRSLSDNLQSRIENFIADSPEFEPGSNEAVCYHLWLRAFLEKKSYYQLVLEDIGYLGGDRRLG